VGKEVFAQSIHNAGRRSQGPFMAINCAALPAQLLESELFGYVGGAFTGANKEGKPGLFEVAHTGTIFLDEIGEMDYVNQGRLLRVLQERAIMRLGSDRIIPVDVRVIAATNKNLITLIARKKFREDLYYRLNVLKLQLLPLRQRRKDIIHYANLMLDQIGVGMGKKVRLSAGAARVLEQYSWPGNIRELRNVLERAMAIGRRNVISTSSMEQLLAYDDVSVGDTVQPSEVESIKRALAESDGKIAAAADRLQITRVTLWRKMKKLNISK
jgi:transcriptional regulator with PAS, ATPase and Fis domain